MRFVIAMMQHETNTFSPQATPYQAFGGPTGYAFPPGDDQAIAAYKGSGFALDAFIDIAEEHGAEYIVPVAANAEPSGPVDDDAFDRISQCICDAIAAGCDGVMLDLHGAMVTDSFEDGEGELLRRIRQIAPDVPIAVSLDMHTNLTEEMVRHATVITGYCTNPHIDMYETGVRAARTLIRTLAGEIRPVMQWSSLPMLTHLLCQSTSGQPLKDIMDMAIEAEAQGRVLNASVFTGFSLADISHTSFSALVITDQISKQGDALLDDLLRMAWQRRQAFVYEAEDYAESIAYARTQTDGPIVLADHGDNTWAGGSSDNMEVLREVLRQGLTRIAAGPIWDPESVAAMVEAGVGAEVTLQLGGKTDTPALNIKGQPLLISGKVRCITDGSFTIQGPMMNGFNAHIGRSAVLDTGTMEVLVSSVRGEAYDLVHFTHAGIDLQSKKYIVIKSRQHFRAAYEPFARQIVMVAGPGVCSSSYEQFPFRNLQRPIYPLDPDMDYYR